MPKLKVKEIPSFQSYISLVEQYRLSHKNTWYRGVGRTSHKLKPSLYRHSLSKTIEDFMDLEKQLVFLFKQRSIPFHSRNINDDLWEWLFLMQHYGVPSRLLDWTESPFMALFFAVTSASHNLGTNGDPVFENDAAIWVLDPIEWNKKSFDLKTYGGTVLMTHDPLSSSYKPIGKPEEMRLLPIALYGSYNSHRIVAQRGAFICYGKDTRPMEEIYTEDKFPIDCLLKLVVKKEKLPMMYSALLNHGITDSVVFPELSGLAREIRRNFKFEVY